LEARSSSKWGPRQIELDRQSKALCNGLVYGQAVALMRDGVGRPLRHDPGLYALEGSQHRQPARCAPWRTGRRGDADVVFIHAKSAELKFLADGHGVNRYPVMYNDFVLIGPKSDPAGIKGMKDVGKAFQAIKDKRASFISRGDRSGTHIAELQLWKDAGIDIDKDKGPWYKSIGQGMGAALNTAGAADAYALSDG
jgi:hypothetical protein